MIRFRLNGRNVETASHPLARLLDVLRDELGDVSVKEGCGEGECGACAVMKDGKAVSSCLIPLIQADGSDLWTMTGLRETELGGRLIGAFAKEGAVQCGFCMPGLVTAAVALLSENPSPGEREIREGLSGNLCRCTGYDLVVKAVVAVVKQGVGE